MPVNEPTQENAKGSHRHFCPTCKESWDCACSSKEILESVCGECDPIGG
jgi:hypothetical protein